MERGSQVRWASSPLSKESFGRTLLRSEEGLLGEGYQKFWAYDEIR
ncbi:MAG: hypothetical protein QXW80_04435 [Candidatus Micrarchaeia archaeon]